METGFGRPLGPVTLHRSAEAAAVTRRLGAGAFNVGTHIAFGERLGVPGTFSGDLLLAHELAHVIQRTGGTGTAMARGTPVATKLPAPAPRDGAEREADLAAAFTVLRAGGHEQAIHDAIGLSPRQQSGLRRHVPRLGHALGLRLTSCGVQEGPATWAPDVARFQSITQQLNVLYQREQAIRAGREPITARADVSAQIDALTGDLATDFGVRLTPDELREALATDPHRLDHLLTDFGAELVVSPAPPYRMLQTLDFNLRLGLIPPDVPLEVEWRWTIGHGRENRFLILGDAFAERSGALHLQLDTPFWGVQAQAPEITQAGGFIVLAKVYLHGATQPVTVASTPFLRLEPVESGTQAVQIVSEVRAGRGEPKPTNRAVVGTRFNFRLADWVPVHDLYELEWDVDGKRQRDVPVPWYEFSTVDEHKVSVAVWRRHPARTLVGRDTKNITIVEPEVVAEPALTQMRERGVSGLGAVRTSMDTAIATLRPLAASGQPRAAYYGSSLKAQEEAAGKVDEFTRPALGGRPLSTAQPLPSNLVLMQEGQAYTGPINAVLVVHYTAEAQPLGMHLVTWHEPGTTELVDVGELGTVPVAVPARWHARLIDLTGAHVVKFDGQGPTALGATTAAFQHWRDDNPYPQGCTVVYQFSPVGWAFPQRFSTNTTEKEVLEWIDGILAVGAIVVGGLLLLAPEPTGLTKALGVAVLAATVARSTYAIAKYRDLGYDWGSREIALEGISIVTSFVGLGGGLVRQAGVRAGRALLLKIGTTMVLASALTDAGTLVFLTYDAYEQIRALQGDPRINDSQREMAIIQLISGLMLQGVMLVVSNRELFTGGMGRTRKFQDRFGDPAGLLPEGHGRTDMELTLMEAGVARRDLPTDPRALTDLFLAHQRQASATAELDHLREQLAPERRAQFDAERLQWQSPEDFLDYLTAGGTQDAKTFIDQQPSDSAVGGTRGPPGTYREKAGASSPSSLHSEIQRRFIEPTSATRARMHGATLDGLTVTTGPPQVSSATLSVPMADGTVTTVAVQFRSVSAADLPRGPHGRGGGESGPARMRVTRTSAGRYEADIFVFRDLHTTDAADAMGHELDELAGLVRGGYSGPKLAAQQRAGLLRPTTARRPSAPTVHDEAQARELVAVYNRQSGLPEQRLAAMADKLRAWGLQDPRYVEAKIAFLRDQGVPEDLLRALHADLSFRSLGKGAATPPFMDPDRIKHILYPDAPAGIDTLVGGAHFDPALQAHQAATPDQRYVQVAQKKGADGTTYRSYAQLQWNAGVGGTPPSPGDSRIPAALAPSDPGYPGLNITPAQKPLWSVASGLKTTFDDPGTFLAEAQSAWQNFLVAGGGTGNFKWNATSAHGVHVEGWAVRDATGKYTVLTVYPDGAWVR